MWFVICFFAVLFGLWITSLRDFRGGIENRAWLRSGTVALVLTTVSFGLGNMIMLMKRWGMTPNHINAALSGLFLCGLGLAAVSVPLGFCARRWWFGPSLAVLSLALVYLWAVGLLASIAV